VRDWFWRLWYSEEIIPLTVEVWDLGYRIDLRCEKTEIRNSLFLSISESPREFAAETIETVHRIRFSEAKV